MKNIIAELDQGTLVPPNTVYRAKGTYDMSISTDTVVAGIKSIKASREKDPKTNKWINVKSDPKNKLTFIDVKKVSPTAINASKLKQDSAAIIKPKEGKKK